MRRVSLGRGGPSVGAVGLGFWQAGSRLWGSSGVGPERVRAVLEEAQASGIDFIDTAEVYGWGSSERLLGEALRRFNPSDFVVASKVAGFRASRRDVYSGAESIRRRLRGRLDLIQHHWPPPLWSDLCGVVRGLEDAVKAGLAGYYGFSNYGEGLLEEALECSRRIDPVSDQVQYSLAYRAPEWGLASLLESRGMRLIAWSPLAKGALAGLREPRAPAQRGDPFFRAAASNEALQRALARVASRLGATKAQVALAWLISRRALPIPGTLNPARVREYAGAAAIELGEEDLKLLDEASRKHLHEWGRRYDLLDRARLVPGTLQRLALALVRGI